MDPGRRLKVMDVSVLKISKPIAQHKGDLEITYFGCHPQ